MKGRTFIRLVVVSEMSLITCNAVHGMGKDIEKGAQAIATAAAK